MLNGRLAPLKTANPTAAWPTLIGMAAGNCIDLLAEGWFSPTATPSGFPFNYFVWAAACTVVEVDVLTGELQILSTDLVYDCGESLNPLVDVGQVEGAFVMGLGEYLTEDVVFDADGKLLSVGSFEYKPPFPLDIPQKMNVRWRGRYSCCLRLYLCLCLFVVSVSGCHSWHELRLDRVCGAMNACRSR